MIVIDSSALIAILDDEPESGRFLNLIRNASRRLASAVTIYETGIVIGNRRGWESADDVLGLIDQLDIEIVAFAGLQITAALDAYSRFGKGVDPKARLNLGDCVAYALAKSVKAPLLFKGQDFSATDIEACA